MGKIVGVEVGGKGGRKGGRWCLDMGRKQGRGREVKKMGEQMTNFSLCINSFHLIFSIYSFSYIHSFIIFDTSI